MSIRFTQTGLNVYSAEYDRVHKQIRKERGPARNLNCIDCGKQDCVWTYKHETDPYDIYNYDPRCVKCHNTYDAVATLPRRVTKPSLPPGTTSGTF